MKYEQLCLKNIRLSASGVVMNIKKNILQTYEQFCLKNIRLSASGVVMNIKKNILQT